MGVMYRYIGRRRRSLIASVDALVRGVSEKHVFSVRDSRQSFDKTSPIEELAMGAGKIKGRLARADHSYQVTG